MNRPMAITHWDIRYLDLAKLVSTWSKDPSTQVGAVIVSPKNRVISLGFNGFPARIRDNERLHNRDQKLDIIIHGEMNAILTADHSLDGSTLYTYPFLPCSRCASMVIQVGIIHAIAPKYTGTRWESNLMVSRDLFFEARVSCLEVEYI